MGGGGDGGGGEGGGEGGGDGGGEGGGGEGGGGEGGGKGGGMRTQVRPSKLCVPTAHSEMMSVIKAVSGSSFSS